MPSKEEIYYCHPVFRPPSEAYSLLIQLTEGCTFKCDFCMSNLRKKFLIRDVKLVKKDLDVAKKIYGSNVKKIFFLDGNAMVTPTEKLVDITKYAFEIFPNLERCGVYAHSKDILKKSNDQLKMLIDNKKYTIKRNLKRSIKNKKSTVSQEEGSIIEYSGSNLSKTSYAPTDLRRKILKLLNYSITRYENAQKIPLFRYTVYTPQEQVKEILQAKPEERFEILKDVFGIEKYEIALKNISVLNEFLYNSIKETKIYLDSIGNPDLLINKKEKEIDEQLKIVNKIEASLAESIADLERVEQQVDTFQSEVNEYSKKSVEINNYYNIVEESNIFNKENEN